jgi:GTPase SAR1 family protein
MYRLAIIGDPSSGKSSLIAKWTKVLFTTSLKQRNDSLKEKPIQKNIETPEGFEERVSLQLPLRTYSLQV